MKPYRVETVVSAPFMQNSLVVWDPETSEGFVVDPGFEVEGIVSAVRRHGVRLKAVINTHGHVDHIAGNREVLDAFPGVPLWIGRNDAFMLTDPDANLSAPFGLPITSPPADRLLDEGEEVEVAGLRFLIREIPGHSPGSIVFISEEREPPFALVGDVVFAGSIGRSDFPGGDGRLLVRGVREKLLGLPERTILYPGHGPETTVGQEKRSNPFVGIAASDGPGA
jgi:glyoxylase-like metal-dependent hydrolase (beta-lactamase superfamily II)